jgi:hypothetical protein
MALDKASADILGMTIRLFCFQRSIVGVFSSLTILNLELPSYLSFEFIFFWSKP